MTFPRLSVLVGGHPVCKNPAPTAMKVSIRQNFW